MSGGKVRLKPKAFKEKKPVKIRRTREVAPVSNRWMRGRGVSGAVARGAAENGRSVTYQRYTRATNFALRLRFSWG